MSYVKFIFIKSHPYIEEADNSKMEILGLFLTNEVDDTTFWKDWINNPAYEDTTGNLMFVDKKNNKIIIGHLYTEDWYETVFETTKKQFLEILDRWEELCKQRPREIIITKEGDKVTLEGKN